MGFSFEANFWKKSSQVEEKFRKLNFFKSSKKLSKKLPKLPKNRLKDCGNPMTSKWWILVIQRRRIVFTIDFNIFEAFGLTFLYAT